MTEETSASMLSKCGGGTGVPPLETEESLSQMLRDNGFWRLAGIVVDLRHCGVCWACTKNGCKATYTHAIDEHGHVWQRRGNHNHFLMHRLACFSTASNEVIRQVQTMI